MNRVTAAAFISVLTFPGLAAAGPMEDSAPPLSLGPSYTASGSSYGFSDQINLRLGTQALSLDLGEPVDTHSPSRGAPYATPDAMVDFYPFEGTLRLSGGFLYNPDTLEFPAPESNGITIGGLPFTPSGGGATTGRLDFSAYTPYAGLGVQSSFWSGRLEFALDFGLQYDIDGGSDSADDTAKASSDGTGDSDVHEDNLDFLGFSPRAGLSVKLKF